MLGMPGCLGLDWVRRGCVWERAGALTERRGAWTATAAFPVAVVAVAVAPAAAAEVVRDRVEEDPEGDADWRLAAEKSEDGSQRRLNGSVYSRCDPAEEGARRGSQGDMTAPTPSLGARRMRPPSGHGPTNPPDNVARCAVMFARDPRSSVSLAD